MKISIITATYNSEAFLNELYESIKLQTNSNWEWVVTDDCSTDSTISILKEIVKNDKRVRFYQLETNSGAACARNNSIRKSSNRFLAFVDSDDIWEVNKLDTQLDYMNNNKVSFCFTGYQIINENGDLLDKQIDCKVGCKFSYVDMLKKKATLGCSTVMLDKELLGADILMPDIRTGQDYATWLKILKVGGTASLIPIPLTKYRLVKGSISSNKFKKAKRQWKIYRELEGLNVLYSLYCFLHYAIRVVIR